MTVIAFDGRRWLPIDWQCKAAASGVQSQRSSASEIACWRSLANGISAPEAAQWFKSGASPSAFPDKARDGRATLIVFDRDAVCVKTFNSGPTPMLMAFAPCAFGSGRDYAEAAMYLGCDAAEAVEVKVTFRRIAV